MRKRKLSILLTTALVASLVFSGCGKSGTKETADGTNQGKTESDKTGTTSGNTGKDGSGTESKPIKMQLCYWDSDVPTGDEKIIQDIEKATGTTLDIIWAPPSAMTEKTTTTIAGNNLPEVLEIINPDMRTQIVQDAMTGGMFWDLTDYIKDYPNLNSISEATYNSMKYDGRIYTIPRMIPKRDSGLMIREDWLDNLGLEVPKTLDDYYKVLKAFTYDDPDGNGKDDTVGLNMFVGCVVHPLVLAAGCPIDWWIDETDNTVKPMQDHPQYMTFLNFMKKLYDEGLVNREFTAATMQTSEQAFMEEKAGMVPGSVGKVTQGTYFTPLYDKNPNAKVVASTENIGPDGKLYAHPNPGYWGMYCISKKAVPTEERLRQILQFFNDIMNPEIVDLFVKGEKGVHYTEENGQFKWIDQQKFIDDSKGASAFYVTSTITEQLNLGIGEHDKEYYEWENNTSAIEFPDLSTTFVLPNDLMSSTIVTDAANNYVAGVIDEEELRAIWKQWKEKEGGAKILEEFNKQYQVLSGK